MKPTGFLHASLPQSNDSFALLVLQVHSNNSAVNTSMLLAHHGFRGTLSGRGAALVRVEQRFPQRK